MSGLYRRDARARHLYHHTLHLPTTLSSPRALSVPLRTYRHGATLEKLSNLKIISMSEENTNTPSTSGSGNKMWYIIGAIAAVVLVGGFLSRGIGFMGMRAAGVDVNSNADGTMTYSNEEGTVTVGGGASMPSNWPSDAPANYSGASIQYSGSSNPQTGEAGSAVVYTVNASTQSVIDYYKSELAKNGWTVEATANMAGATVLSGKKDTRTFGIYVVDAGNGSVSVTIGIGM